MLDKRSSLCGIAILIVLVSLFSGANSAFATEMAKPSHYVTLEQKYYNLAEIAKITLYHKEANKNPDLIDFAYVHLSSDSDKTGLDILVEEIAVNEGYFIGYVQFGGDTDGVTSLKTNGGDLVYVKFNSLSGSAEIVPFYSESSPSTIHLSTDRTSYEYKDQVVFSGIIKNYDPRKEHYFLVKSPDNSIVELGHVNTSDYGPFRDILFSALGHLELSGNYVIETYHGTASAQTTFYYSNSEPFDVTLAKIFSPPPESSPSTIHLSTDRTSYEHGDTFVFSGNIKNYDSSSGKKLSLIIKSPDNSIVDLWQQTPKNDGSFGMSLSAKKLFGLSGNYVIETYYDTASAQTTFYYSTSDPKPEPEPTGSVGIITDSVPDQTRQNTLDVVSQEQIDDTISNPSSQNDARSELIEENKKLREDIQRQKEQIDELNEEVDLLKQLIQSIQGFFSSIFG